MGKFEYKSIETIIGVDDRFDTLLNKMAAEGYETHLITRLCYFQERMYNGRAHRVLVTFRKSV